MGLTKEYVEKILRDAIDDGGIRSEVRQILGKQHLSRSKLSIWRKNPKLPDTLEDGAALFALGQMAFDQKNLPLMRERVLDLERTGLYARSCWHVFCMTKDFFENATGNWADCHVWRFWEAIRATEPERPRWLSHTTTLEASDDRQPIETFGDGAGDAIRDATVILPGQASKVCVYQRRVGTTPENIGYHIRARKTLRVAADREYQHDFFGGCNTICVERSVILGFLPEPYLATSINPVMWYSIASPLISAFDYVYKTVLKLQKPDEKLASLFEPWGQQGTVVPQRLPDIPPALLQEMKKNVDLDSIDYGYYRLLYAEFRNPPPLTVQLLVWPLNRHIETEE